MANVSISYDTKDKTCSILFNGQPLDKVSGINMYKFEYGEEDDRKEEYHIELTMEEMLGDDKAYKVTRIYASQAEENKLNIDDLSTYVLSEEEFRQKQIVDWLTKN